MLHGKALVVELQVFQELLRVPSSGNGSRHISGGMSGDQKAGRIPGRVVFRKGLLLRELSPREQR